MQPSLYISTPTHHGVVNIHYTTSLLMTVQRLIEARIHYQLDIMIGAGIDSARSRQATNFLNSGYSHMLMIDDDMGWAADLPIRMMQENLDVLGVPYRKKNTGMQFNLAHEDHVAQHPTKPYLISVDQIATGMMMVKREVFEALIPHVPLVKHHKDEPPIYMFFQHAIIDTPKLGGLGIQSEDYFFCDLARSKLGCEIIAYADEDVAHFGPYAYRGSYAEQLEKQSTNKFSVERDRDNVRILIK